MNQVSSSVPPRPAVTSPPAQAGAKMVMPTAADHKSGVRVVLVAVNGWGKTTIGSFGEDPVVVMSPDEQGYMTLQSRGLVPTVPVMQVRSWPELLATIAGLAKDSQGRKTIVLDALAGMESLCAKHVCETQYKGDWGEKGFMAFYRGPAQVAREWPALLLRLTSCARAGLNVIVLGHAKVQKFNNPDGPDYDRYECACGTSELWGRTRDWAEAVLFGNFKPIVETARPEDNIAKAKGKAIGQKRMMRCQYSASADAKNQYGLGPEYSMPDTAEACASAFWNLIKNGDKK